MDDDSPQPRCSWHVSVNKSFIHIEYLPGIQQPAWIQGALDTPHNFDSFLSDLFP